MRGTVVNYVINFKNFLTIQIYNPDSSDDCKKDWSRINWPPLFCKAQVRLEELSEEMRAFYRDYGTEPRLELTQRFSATDITLSTEMVKFLVECGFIVTDVSWVLQFQRGIFSNFVKLSIKNI